MAEKKIEMSSTWELNLKIPQQGWIGNNAIQSCYFAGLQMILMFIALKSERPSHN